MPMAPNDREERRAQRLRGAGTTQPVQTNFGFTFGGSAASLPPVPSQPTLQPQRSSRRTPQPVPTKQASLPPQPFSRRTPVETNFGSTNGSARRHRSASIPRSSGVNAGVSKGDGTPRLTTPTVTGKRKRGSQVARQSQDDELDELSPVHDEEHASVERSRRVAATVSPIQEELIDALDELGTVQEDTVVMSSTQKIVPDEEESVELTPMPAGPKTRPAQHRSPILSSQSKSTSTEVTRPSSARNAKHAEPPITPATRRPGRPRKDISPPVAEPSTESSEQNSTQDADEGEDELSPDRAEASTSKLISSAKSDEPASQSTEEDNGVDELSPEGSKTETTKHESMQSKEQSTQDKDETVDDLSPDRPHTVKSTRATSRRADRTRRPGRVVRSKIVQNPDAEGLNTVTPAAARSRRTHKVVEDEEEVDELSPALNESQRKKQETVEHEEETEEVEEVDELSPDLIRTKRPPSKPALKEKDVQVIPSDEEDSDAYEEGPEQEEEVSEPTPAPIEEPKQAQPRPRASKEKKTRVSDKPPRKRRRRDEPAYGIDVHRLKAPKSMSLPSWTKVKGITAVDVSAQHMSEFLEAQIERVTDKAENIQDPAYRRLERSKISTMWAFKDALENQYDLLREAVDTGNAVSNRLKAARIKITHMRSEYLAIRNQQLEIDLQMDELREEHRHEVEEFEAWNELNSSMFDIEAAIQSGIEKARTEGRQEGPDVPLNMLLQSVAKDVGGNYGLLGSLREFNGFLERAAGVLEGRA
ncbi:hypothetical protein K469DRAFT_694479 [Zopfia rhizophila CBS 207.26]|uniref:Inner kinetochore subunit AME1 domain-containing protein n=1 Tax=Zopfia rhizophila CBS 207.26 TaxID=1314779 RepID=A0A6A6ENM4_9PEZI|nr:hypothetical protein K469DRAFT_694479 [Zopfia rhizophila CBS 207.26]